MLGTEHSSVPSCISGRLQVDKLAKHTRITIHEQLAERDDSGLDDPDTIKVTLDAAEDAYDAAQKTWAASSLAYRTSKGHPWEEDAKEVLESVDYALMGTRSLVSALIEAHENAKLDVSESVVADQNSAQLLLDVLDGLNGVDFSSSGEFYALIEDLESSNDAEDEDTLRLLQEAEDFAAQAAENIRQVIGRVVRRTK